MAFIIFKTQGVDGLFWGTLNTFHIASASKETSFSEGDAQHIIIQLEVPLGLASLSSNLGQAGPPAHQVQRLGR